MLSVMNDISSGGVPVDWWFMYKLPHGQVKEKTETPNASERSLTGFSYLYADGENKLALSPYDLGKDNKGVGGDQGALHSTLKTIFEASAEPDSDVGWLLYNDEIPGTKKNDQLKGHCKGILAFNKTDDSGIWLLHSTPRFPIENDPVFPDNEGTYAQTYIAITLEGYDAVTQIAAQLRRQQTPQVYGHSLPKTISDAGDADEVFCLSKGIDPVKGPLTSEIAFKSRGGVEFKSIAKNRHWGDDFWIDLVGPILESDLKVETWRRGKIPGEEDSNSTNTVADVGGIDLSSVGVPVGWHYTHDHAKWATSVTPDSKENPAWVCIADMNRQVSQEKRGGGSICFQEQQLWQALASIEVTT